MDTEDVTQGRSSSSSLESLNHVSRKTRSLPELARKCPCGEGIENYKDLFQMFTADIETANNQGNYWHNQYKILKQQVYQQQSLIEKLRNGPCKKCEKDKKQRQQPKRVQDANIALNDGGWDFELKSDENNSLAKYQEYNLQAEPESSSSQGQAHQWYVLPLMSSNIDINGNNTDNTSDMKPCLNVKTNNKDRTSDVKPFLRVKPKHTLTNLQGEPESSSSQRPARQWYIIPEMSSNIDKKAKNTDNTSDVRPCLAKNQEYNLQAEPDSSSSQGQNIPLMSSNNDEITARSKRQM